MLFDQIPQQGPERLALVVFRKDAGNVTGNRIGSPGSDFPVDSRQLILGQTDRDLGSGHTSITPRQTGVMLSRGLTDETRDRDAWVTWQADRLLQERDPVPFADDPPGAVAKHCGVMGSDWRAVQVA